MRSVVVIALAVMLVAAASASPSMSSYLERFQKFKVDFKRAYADEFEDAKRFGYFVANMKKAAELEKTNPYATFGENEFADYSAAELKAHHCYRPTSAAERNESAWFSDEQVKARATSIDWRARGAVTSVKDQGNCGSCFAFAATANIESSWAIAGNPLIDLSEQMVVSCDTTDGGCNGGVESSVYTWLLKSQGGKLVSLASYPYTGKKAACSIPANAASATITSWLSVPKNEAQMATQVANVGPVSIGIDSTALDAYKSGVLTNCQNKALDHSVIIIGFDDGSVPPYWIIKNSWGPSFGENGYFRVAMNTNQCGLTSDPTATLAKSVGPAPGPVPPTPPGPTPPSPPRTPMPPMPPMPPTTDAPGPSPTGPVFTRHTCSDPLCQSCTEESVPLDMCVPLAGCKSVSAVCTKCKLEVTNYLSSNQCDGVSEKLVTRHHQCQVDLTGGYHYWTCDDMGASEHCSRA